MVGTIKLCVPRIVSLSVGAISSFFFLRSFAERRFSFPLVLVAFVASLNTLDGFLDEECCVAE